MRDYGKSLAPWGPSYCVHRDVLVNVEEDDANNTHVKNNDFRLHLVDTPANVYIAQERLRVERQN